MFCVQVFTKWKILSGVFVPGVKKSLEEEKILKAFEKNQIFYRGISAAPGDIF